MSYALLKVNFFQNPTYHAKLTTSVGWNDTQASPRPFCDPSFSSSGLLKIMGFWSWNIYDLSFSSLYLKIIIKLRKNSSFNWFTPFHVLIHPVVIWKKLSRPLYHVPFIMIHTNSRHTWSYHGRPSLWCYNMWPYFQDIFKCGFSTGWWEVGNHIQQPLHHHG